MHAPDKEMVLEIAPPTAPTMDVDEALALLRAVHGHARLDDAWSLIDAVSALATDDVRAGRVGEALLVHDLERLTWDPIEGAALIRALLVRGEPSAALLGLSLSYLSLYFQELDGVIEGCRRVIEEGGSLVAAARALSNAGAYPTRWRGSRTHERVRAPR